MNKKAFTLIELLAVIAIIALISLIAIPNIVNLSDGIRKDEMLADARKLISMAKSKVNTDYEIKSLIKADICESGVSCTFSFASLNTNGDIKQDPDSNNGDNYVSGFVTYTNDGTERYCVYLEGIKRKICQVGNNSDVCNQCVYEENLYSRTNVHDN